ncbi:polymer-forming cytoskeletal protein [Salinicola sp. JS01]|uniref:bactofilin family protein n=1 Tax=Salinicola sp. JS01 TaxID=3050071 RepID=UPI00255B8BF7|nr:polymer-forming cytoskeletal protein [Salinicola sp. JS01]WIX34764.1 polymer-forming cytoskeletal protein [Salinicola sp. JS01]
MFPKSSQALRQTNSSDAASAPVRGNEPTQTLHGMSRIGAKTTIRGDVNGDEDLLIEGRIVGDVSFPHHAVTVGSDGQIEGRLIAREITVKGRVEGQLIAAERITLKATAEVQGELYAPGLILEDGAAFHGNIDMNAEHAVLREAFGTERRDSSAVPTATAQSDEEIEEVNADRAAE